MAGPGRITLRSREAVREAADLVALVEARTGPGRRSGGGQMLFRCPFHDERTASFSVDPADKLYHCFGCGRGGDVFQFVQELEGLGFADAVEFLADRHGVELEYEELSPRERDVRDRGRRVDTLLEDVAGFYARYLATSDEARPARAYLAERDVSAESIERFRLGFAPSDWDRVARAAREKGYTVEELYAAGIAGEGRRGPIDRFRGRIIFPLADARGRVRGFGARVMPGEDGPKYLNSAESDVFKKGRLLYGLHLARAAIARGGRALVVEGYTDVIALHAHGRDFAVAAMGTSLTEEQLRELRRLAPDLVLCFDADAAGQDAALRGMALAQAAGFRVRVVPLPPGSDPADLLAEGAAGLDAALSDAESVLSFRTGRALALAEREGAEAAFSAARAILATAPAGPERDAAQRRVAGALRLSRESEAALVPRRGTVAGAPAPNAPARRDRRRDGERDFLAACLAFPPAGREALDAEAEGWISDPALRGLVPWVRKRLAGERDLQAPPEFTPTAAEILARIVIYPSENSETERNLREAVSMLRWSLELADVERRMSELKVRRDSDDYLQENQHILIALQRQRARLLELVSRGRAPRKHS